MQWLCCVGQKCCKSSFVICKDHPCTVIGASLSKPHTYVKYSKRVCIYICTYICLSYAVPYISIWCYEGGHSWLTVAFSLQKAPHDMVNTCNDHNLQIIPLYSTHRKATQKNSQQHNRFWAFWESFHPAYTMLKYIMLYDGLLRREAFWSIFSLPLQMLYMRFLSRIPKNQIVHLIMVPHLKCSPFAS